jgi:hypothetical protein
MAEEQTFVRTCFNETHETQSEGRGNICINKHCNIIEQLIL